MNRRAAFLLAAAAWAGCSDAAAPPPPIELAAFDVVIDGSTALVAGDSLLVRTLSYGYGDIARWPVRVVISSNPGISVQDARIAETVVEASARTPNWSRGPADVRARIPPGTPAGLYYLGLIVDPDGSAGDTNIENNSARSFFRIAVGMVPSNVAAAPVPSAPADHAELGPSPDSVTLRWSPVAAAAWYHVEVDNCPTAPATGSWWTSCAAWETWAQFGSPADSLARPWWGPMAWRWRVRGVDSSGVAGPASAWRTFRMP